jgi:hypothetical protein
VELLDAATQAVVAASRAPLVGDWPRVMLPLEWAAGASFEGWAPGGSAHSVDGRLQLRVALAGGARLYSWWFEGTPTVLDRFGD